MYAIIVFYFIYDGIKGIEGIMNKGSAFLVFFVGLNWYGMNGHDI